MSTAPAPKTTRRFPPPVGWIPFTIGLIAVVLLSIFAVAPQFQNKVVGTTAVAGPGGTGLGAATGPSAAAAQGAPGGTTAGSGTTVAAGAGTAAGAKCAPGQNGGATAPGVTATQINVASTIVKTGVGSGFLGEAVYGIQAAINQFGSICGRAVHLQALNDGWDRSSGAADIQNWISSGSVFALVGEPDSEGLDGVSNGSGGNGALDAAGMPAIGTDGMLTSQYHDPMIFPVAASTVSNMHIIADYAWAHGARTFGIVFDTSYKFGKEGASAFDAEVKRLSGQDIPGYNSSLSQCTQQFCGVPSSTENGGSSGYGSYQQQFNPACQSANGGGKPCDAVVLLLEPGPAETWMKDEANSGQWYKTLYGGEPLFDDNFAGTCQSEGANCGGMITWTGYHPAIAPFSGEPAVNAYSQALKAACPSCDPHNEFTEGAYLGTMLFLKACQQVGPDLTRAALISALNSGTFNLGLSSPLSYSSGHIANGSMAGFGVNAPQNGSFNGWNYLETGFVGDREKGEDQ